MDIKIGDRVSFQDQCVADGRLIYGTVILVHPDKRHQGVAFDDRHSDFHNLGGSCMDGHGYYINPKHLTVVEPMNVPSQLGRRREW
jgi:hypothetical protein